MALRAAGSAFGLILALAVLLRITVFTSVVMSGGAMMPAILPGEFLLVTRGDATHPHRGAILLLECPAPENHACLKRAVAVAGDRVEFRDGRMLVNEVLFEPAVPAPKIIPDTLIVPPESVYVVNDQTGDQDDSRTWGPVSTDLVEGRARLIWLSLDWFTAADEVRDWPRVRWPRLFQTL